MHVPESDAHGRAHRSVEVDVGNVGSFHAAPGTEHEEDEEFVRLSNGTHIPRYAVEDYLATFDTGEHERKFDKTDALVMGSVATISAAALALAIRRLKKNR